MTAEATVIIVSRDREASLPLTLRGLQQQDNPGFEVIVVGDDAARRAVASMGLTDQITFAGFETANISAARNIGVGLAATPLVAFIDDDAVPEPQWLRDLTAPLADPDVAAAAGHVLGPDGLSFQWQGEWINRAAVPTEIAPTGAATLLRAEQDRWPAAMGTNCAFRKDALHALGGFDERFAYYLDESDLMVRLGQSGAATALVPDARVHHHLSASDQRSKDRTPKSLSDIGCSLAVFLSKHCPEAERSAALAHHRETQRRRLLRAMVKGVLTPDDVARLLRQFDRAAKADVTKEPVPAKAQSGDRATVPFANDPPSGRALIEAGSGAAEQAAAEVKNGKSVVLIHRASRFQKRKLTFHRDGYWHFWATGEDAKRLKSWASGAGSPVPVG